MAKADWYHSYSDDHNVHLKGSIEIGHIVADLRQLSRLEGGLEEAKRLWQDHVPIHSHHLPAFFDRPALLNQDIKGLVLEKDVNELQSLLSTFSCERKEYVAYDTNTIFRPSNRFIGFETAEGASKYVALHSETANLIKMSTVKALNEQLDIEIKPDKGTVMAEIKVACLEYLLKISKEHGKDLDFSR